MPSHGFAQGQRIKGDQLPDANYGEALDHLSKEELASSVWQFDEADPHGLWEERVRGIYPTGKEFDRDVEKLKKKIQKSKVIDPITVDEVTPWVEGQHRIKAAMDLSFETIPGFFRVE